MLCCFLRVFSVSPRLRVENAAAGLRRSLASLSLAGISHSVIVDFLEGGLMKPMLSNQIAVKRVRNSG